MLHRSSFTVALSLFAVSVLIHAQSPSPQQPEYTFQVGTRIVLTDVTVTDRNGKPVHGLKASDFQIFDNDKPQVVASFEEHITKPVPPMEQTSTAPGVYSNGFLQHLPPALNIIVIDNTNLNLPDQMYLYYELNGFIKNLPAGQPLAIYWQYGESNLLLQSFTTDRDLLSAAVRKAIPRFPPPDRGSYADSGYTTLQTIENDLERARYPGRKNILWFSGGSSLFLHSDPLDPQLAPPRISPDPALLRDIYDELEANRIAIYPVDARGLQSASVDAHGDLQSDSPFPSQADLVIGGQQGLMQDIANATGGTAFYNNNALDKIAAHWLNNGGSFYTLTYSPKDFRFDNKWHTVKVKLSAEFSGGYTLSYRRGYFADAATAARQKERKPRTLLRSNGDTVTAPDQRSIPIIFQVHVAPASQDAASSTGAAPSTNVQSPQKGTTPYSIHYSLPAADFRIKTVHGKPQVEIGVAVFAFNDEGSAETRLANNLTFAINEDNLRLHPKALIPVDQQINLHKGQKYLYLAIWDMTSGRLGTLQIPFKVTTEPKQPKF
jgi:VWFA-related protein